MEDEKENLNLINRILRKGGYNVLSSHDPREAVHIAEIYEGKIDLLITDVIMPCMNGYELLKEVSRIRPGIGYLFISGYTDNIIESQIGKDFTLRFLQKPFLMKDLYEAVRSLLDEKDTPFPTGLTEDTELC